MKINWGTGIAIFYTCFVAAMLFMVIKSSQNNVHLVEENYYQKDLNYEAFRLKRQNSSEMASKVLIQYSDKNNSLELAFPKEMKDIKGKLTFFRPSNKYLDKTFELKLSKNSTMSILIGKNMPGGKWQIQVDWESLGEKFYKEKTIII